MTDPVFDIQRLLSKKARAANRAATDADFLHREAASIIGERLAATNRQFKAPAILFDGIFSDSIEEAILAEAPPVSGKFKRVAKPSDMDEILDVAPESLDLIVSVFDLHWTNNLPNLLLQINHALKPDGLFLAVLPCEGTLKEARSAFLNAEVEAGSGVASRINLFPHIRQLGDLVRKTGFKLPVVDLEERTIRYSDLKNLIKDLRDNGAGNSGSGKIHALNRFGWGKAKEIYKRDFADTDGKIRATIAMACISGWKEDESQQKPLKPGSAKKRLSDFL